MAKRFPSEELKRPFTAEEQKEIHELIKDIDQLKADSENLSEDQIHRGVQALASHRMAYSGSLRSGNHEPWMRAHAFTIKKVQDGEFPSWMEIRRLNALLTEQDPSAVIRCQDIYTGPWKAVEVEFLADLIEEFKETVLPLAQEHVLIHAAICQYWIVSLHPFWDGNGRTAALLNEWLLALSGYLSQSYQSPLDGLIMYQAERETKSSPARAVLRILKNIQLSYRLLTRVS